MVSLEFTLFSNQFLSCWTGSYCYQMNATASTEEGYVKPRHITEEIDTAGFDRSRGVYFSDVTDSEGS